jgi:large subunit ribosomal protein L10
MNRQEKTQVVEEIAGQIREAQAVLAVDYRGISVPDAAALRARLRDADATFRVVKNSLTERAAEQAGAQALQALLDGPTALTFVRGDAATAAKALADFARGAAALQFKGGLMDGAELTGDEVQAIARLPARDVLYGQLVGLVASPVTGLVRGLNGLLGGLAVQLAQIAEQGLLPGGSQATAEAAQEVSTEAAEEAPAEGAAPATAGDDDAAPATEDEDAAQTAEENKEAS